VKDIDPQAYPMNEPSTWSKSSWAELLKEKRAAAGWSQRELAQRAGVHQPQIVRAERGEDLQLSVLARIAAPLGLAPALASMAPAAENDDVVQPNLESWRRAWPEVDPQVFAVLARLSRLGAHVERGIASLAAAQGLNAGEVMVLGALRRMGPPFESTPTGLKERLWISLPGLKKRLDRLVARGLVERVDNPLDRRGQMVRMTALGDQALDRLIAHPAPVFKAVRALPDDERRRLSNSLRRLLQQLEGPVEGPFDGL
jgi:DNA-binding MarR family transcriptional regulator/DNA-binding XRE family transcriptional regulator